MDDTQAVIVDPMQEELGFWNFARVTTLPGITLIEESGRWRTREVTYVAGRWPALARIIPHFCTEAFSLHPGAAANPYLRTVVRTPLTIVERPIPVGVVSMNYRLAQHTDVIEKCFAGLHEHGIDPESLYCEVGLTSLGEWMNFRAYFPSGSWSYKPAGDAEPLALRLECFNSVDGSSRLVVLLGWFRFVCANGLVLGETRAELRDVHDNRLDLDLIPRVIARGMERVKSEIVRLKGWEKTDLQHLDFAAWINGDLAEAWGKKAACRVFHICYRGVDVEYADPFAKGKPTEKPVVEVQKVPGSTTPCSNLYEVSQALAWVATRRINSEERVEWQTQIPGLIETLARKKSK